MYVCMYSLCGGYSCMSACISLCGGFSCISVLVSVIFHV